MPEFLGLATREEDDREAGEAKVLIGFPEATKKAFGRDQDGKIVATSIPDPHTRPMGMTELKAAQSLARPDSAEYHFYAEARSSLTAYIESAAGMDPLQKRQADGPSASAGLSSGQGMKH